MNENDTSLSATANLVCKITRDNCWIEKGQMQLLQLHLPQKTHASPLSAAPDQAFLWLRI